MGMALLAHKVCVGQPVELPLVLHAGGLLGCELVHAQVICRTGGGSSQGGTAGVRYGWVTVQAGVSYALIGNNNMHTAMHMEALLTSMPGR